MYMEAHQATALLPVSSTRTSNPRFLRNVVSHDVVSNIFQAHALPRLRRVMFNPLFLQYVASYDVVSNIF